MFTPALRSRLAVITGSTDESDSPLCGFEIERFAQRKSLNGSSVVGFDVNAEIVDRQMVVRRRQFTSSGRTGSGAISMPSSISDFTSTGEA